MDLIIWVKVELNYAKTKKGYCKMMQPGGRISWSIQYFTMKVSLNFNNHTGQTGTYLYPTAADVGGPVFSLCVYTHETYRC